MNVTYTYDSVTRRTVRKGNCPTCGKPTSRTGVFTMTVNPFNKNPDGTPKTYAEVAAAVQAEADAWAPEPAEFEHKACLAAKSAPTPAATTAPDPERLALTEGLRRALEHVGEFTETHGLPMTSVTVLRDHRVNLVTGKRSWSARVGFVPDGEIVMWARALDPGTVTVEDGGHCTYIRIRSTEFGLAWEVDAAITKRSTGGHLGGAAIEWGRDRQGRRAKHGTITVDELAAGLSRMGVAVVVAPKVS